MRSTDWYERVSQSIVLINRLSARTQDAPNHTGDLRTTLNTLQLRVLLKTAAFARTSELEAGTNQSCTAASRGLVLTFGGRLGTCF